MKRHTDALSLEILPRVKTALYALMASRRPMRVRPLARYDGLPWKFSRHDFGEWTLSSSAE
jgi:hypothetical protein